ncbi:putative porin [Novosphingobium gossypii]|uniref:putative porin n=1 Tax=Novosphingobium gossypii TaxID=1604774 RepID=UPI003D197B69
MTQVVRLKSMLMACVAVLSASPALAQDAASQTAIDPRLLVEQLVAEGILTQAQADRMIAKATVPVPVAQAPVTTPAPALAGGIDADGVQTIPYVPQVVRDQITEQVRTQLATQAQTEGWAKPGETPEWTRRISLYGDVRARFERRFFDRGNADIFPNYGAINEGDPQNINPNTPGYIPPAFLNTLANRNRAQLRARLGVRAKIDDWIGANIRLATGNDRTPVSTNQTLGAFGGGGYQVWLDRAAIKLTPVRDVDIQLGRFGNPFFTTDLMFDPDMGFDGVAVSGRAKVNEGLTFFGTAGAFPVFNTALNFGSRNAPAVDEDGDDSYPGVRGAYKSQDKYLFAGQAGVEFHPSDKIAVRLAGAYFAYDNVEGRVSAPCEYYEVTCSTDATRPAFQQFGNTVFPIRDVIPDPLNPTTSVENQFFGLASKFRVLNVHGAIDFIPSDKFGMRLEGDFVKNLAWNRARVASRAINNLGPQTTIPDPNNANGTIVQDGTYMGGDTGWQARLTVGSALSLNTDGDADMERGGWNLMFAYRRLQSDAILDAFADSDFGLGGTNVKGWYVAGNYAIGHNTMVGGRWISSDEIADAPLSVDRLFVDLVTRF